MSLLKIPFIQNDVDTRLSQFSGKAQDPLLMFDGQIFALAYP